MNFNAIFNKTKDWALVQKCRLGKEVYKWCKPWYKKWNYGLSPTPSEEPTVLGAHGLGNPWSGEPTVEGNLSGTNLAALSLVQAMCKPCVSLVQALCKPCASLQV